MFHSEDECVLHENQYIVSETNVIEVKLVNGTNLERNIYVGLGKVLFYIIVGKWVSTKTKGGYV